MISIHKIFAELNGFIIYEPELLKKYLELNHLEGNDILRYFTDTEYGDKITESGIAIPIIGVVPDYYSFAVTTSSKTPFLKKDEVLVKTTGWRFNCFSGNLKVVGVGYFRDISMINDKNSISFYIDTGWYKVEISGGKNADGPVFELGLEKTENIPDFYGDIQSEYLFE